LLYIYPSKDVLTAEYFWSSINIRTQSPGKMSLVLLTLRDLKPAGLSDTTSARYVEPDISLSAGPLISINPLSFPEVLCKKGYEIVERSMCGW
jgi:hypothetical protein